MNNNTSNYKEYTFRELMNQYDKILVPMIQRDYAQGRTDKKAKDVRNNLLNDIFGGNRVHFDLVFGSVESRIVDGDDKVKRYFIPIDGQQRLTTLFLLYLYGQRLLNLYQELDLSKFTYDTRRAAADFCKSIISEEWHYNSEENVSDAIKDCSWFIDYWAQDPTVDGMLNMLNAIHDKYKQVKSFPDIENITFYFFDLESHGLNENLYLKMNSRGKPLTAFENLKAKIEKVLPDNIEIEEKCFPECNAAPKDSFKNKWKFFMDRNWTKAFWDSTNPDKYDVNIAKFIVRFLAGYWAAFGQETAENTTAEDLKKINRKEPNDKNYSDYIQFEPIEQVLRLDNAFSSLAYALKTAPEIDPYWTNDAIKVSDRSEYKILAVIFTYVLFESDNAAMRFAWNMAENYVTEYDTFITYCKRAGEIHKFKCNKDVTFYKALSEINFVGNTSDQLKEEIAKANQILNSDCDACEKFGKNKNKTWKEIIIEAETFAFFKGSIRFLFTDGEGKINWCDFDTKWVNAQKYFDRNGVKRDYAVSLTKKLVIQCDNWSEQLYDKQIFKPNANTWKWILTAKSWIAPLHNILLSSEINATNDNNNEKVKKYITPILKDLPFEYIINHEPDGRFHWFGPRLGFYKPRGRDMATLDWENWRRNAILSTLLKSGVITTNAQMGNSDFFWGWNVNFNYSGKCFQWYGNPNEKELDVYLMEDNWENYKKRLNPAIEKGTDEDTYYCFRVETDTSPDAFIGLLDSLINLAFPNRFN